jgi:hypothetical protein
MSMTDPTLQLLGRLVGTWTTEATHPAMPGLTVHGSVTVEWLEGERFLIHRARTDHPDFPDSISIIGHTEDDRVDETTHAVPVSAERAPMRMHYYDSRGVYRAYEARIDNVAWRWWREVPGFSQRFNGTFTDGGDTIVGRSELRRDDVHWVDDLQITYRRSLKPT